MKALKVTNASNRLITFGCKNGRMMILNKGESKNFDSELATLFEKEIVRYNQDGFVDIDELDIKPAALPKQKTVVDNTTKHVIKEEKRRRRRKW